MRARLARLGVEGVEARTFHSAALAQLRRAKGDGPGRILSTKALILRQIGNTLPPPYRFRPAGDLATEVEWAKNRRLTPQTYRDGLNGHEPPIPENLMASAFREYERRKEASGAIDFEDLLELTVRMYEEDEWALAALRERYAAFTVDEYQDVNLLQQSLLELWLGGRQDVCAVGDDYQSIYGFTGASPSGCSASRRGPRTRPSCGSRTTSGPRRRCSRSPTGSCRSSAAPRRRCAPHAARGRSPSCGGSSRPRTRARSCSSACGRSTPRACRTRRWPCWCG